MKLGLKFGALVVAGLVGVSGSAAFAGDTGSQDKKFVTDAGEGSLGEIQMAKLALKNSTNKDVRAFATKMIHDHTMLLAQMKPFATQMGVPAPTMDNWDSSMKDEYKRLEGKKGESFDKDYVQTMTDDHHKDVADFTKERDTTENAALKDAVSKGLVVVTHHRDMIDGLAQKMSLSIPSKP